MEIVDNNNNNNNQIVSRNEHDFEAFFYDRLQKYLLFVKFMTINFALFSVLYLMYKYVNYLIWRYERNEELLSRAEEYQNMIYNDYLCFLGQYLWEIRGLDDWSPNLCYYLHKELYEFTKEYEAKHIRVANTYIYVK